MCWLMTATEILYANEHLPDGCSQFHQNSFISESWAENRQFNEEGTIPPSKNEALSATTGLQGYR